MHKSRVHETTCRTILAVAAALLLSGVSQGQASTADAQVEANVLKALASAPQLATENITSSTFSGTVTLSGTVKDEPTRQMAETLASHASGVKKVIDEIALDGSTGAAAANASQGTNPLLQSDGTMAPPAQAQTQDQGQPQHAPDPDTYAAQHGIQAQDPQAPQSGTSSNQPAYRQPYGPGAPEWKDAPNGQSQNQQGQSQSAQQPGYPQGQPGSPQQGQRPYPPQGQPAYEPQGGYRSGGNPPPPPYGAQVGGQPVTVVPGALLRIRINEGLDSKYSQPGAPFDGVVLNDVVADGAVAIPRGASVQGVVTDAQSGGAIRGHGELALQLRQVTLGGKVFPIVSDVWQRNSDGKGGQTVGNAVGLGAAGALIGAIAGGGPGALVGAGIGGAAGVGASAASGGRQVLIPPEAILTFHLAQPAAVATVSQAEMDRLSYGVPLGAQQQPPPMRRRYPQPYYGPVYYPRPYPYPPPY